LHNSYSSNYNRRTLVQDLKYRFRIKAAQKSDLYDPASASVSSLSRVSVEDVRNIWIHRLIAEMGMPSYKVDIPHELVRDMEKVIAGRIPRDDKGCITYEHFLPTIVHLIRIEVSPEEEEEIIEELFNFYFWSSNNGNEMNVEELRAKALIAVKAARDMATVL